MRSSAAGELAVVMRATEASCRSGIRRPSKSGVPSRSSLQAEPRPALRNHNHAMDDHGRAALERLSASGRNSDRITAAEAIVSVLPPDAWPSLFADCVIAEWRARNHKTWNEDATDRPGAGGRSRRGVTAIVARFLRKTEAVGDPSDPVGEALGTPPNVYRNAAPTGRRPPEVVFAKEDCGGRPRTWRRLDTRLARKHVPPVSRRMQTAPRCHHRQVRLWVWAT